jgi:membrane-bound lytic murein transglycosylase B
MNPAMWVLVALVLLLISSEQQPSPAPRPVDAVVDAPQPFNVWLDGLVAEARERGYPEPLLTEAFTDLEPLVRVVQHDRTQAELTTGFETYFASRVNSAVVQRGREAAKTHRRLLARIERTYGVPGRIVLAIWGMESRYGRNTGRTPVFQALATLAWEPRRANFFRGQLFDALTIVSRGHIDVDTMRGSWAGAMGQTQFMPSSYLEYAVDEDGDGRRDIWTSTPDVLGSIANYLKGHGWTPEHTWGREVRVSSAARARIGKADIGTRESGCYAMRDMTARMPLEEWQRLGVRRVEGGALPRADLAAGLVDSGDRSFLVYENYDALLRYNCAHHYALSVAMLAERLR